MSSIPRLPYIIVRAIEELWIGEVKNRPAVKDSAIPEEFNQDKLISPFLCVFTGTAISDGFYIIPATTKVNISLDSVVLVTDWSLSYTDHLHLSINKAHTQDIKVKSAGPLIGIERNPLVANTLRRYKFLKLQKEMFEADSECSEKSEKFLINLGKINESLGRNDESVFNDQGSDIVEKKGDLGKVLQMVKEEKPLGKVIELSYNLGIEVFPSYALEYLKHKYNVV